MKNLFAYVSLLCTMSFFISCGSDDPEVLEFSGPWIMTSIRDDCSNSADNVKIDAGQYGFCQDAGNGGEECLAINFDLNNDGSFVFETQRTLLGGSIVLPETPLTEQGTYSVSGSNIILTYNDGEVLTFNGNEQATTLDWAFAKSPSGCDRKWGFVRN